MRTTSTDPLPRPPFPTEVVRDLLGLVRSLYRAELALPPPRADRLRLDQLLEIGQQLRRALEMGTTCEPDSMGGRAAVAWAEKATAALGEYVGASMLVAPAVNATVAQLRRAR